MCHKTITLLLITIFLVGIIQAGLIDGELQDKISQTSGNDFIRVIIRPVSYSKSSDLQAIVSDNSLSTAQRYQAGVRYLKNVADETQPPIKNHLQQLEMAGSVRNIQSYWIANLIEAEVRADALKDLAADGNIDIIEISPKIVPLDASTAVSTAVASPALAGVQPNLNTVNAPAAWAMGYDGTGSLVCSFDTGVDGDHTALTANYRGNKGFPAAECWFSPVDSSTYPHAFFGQPTYDHGTHTTGIMVGHNDATGDTVGVAPGADWIAAVAIDTYGSSAFLAWQWAADPDGNPNTTYDLPDVINHSWGIDLVGCRDIFWEVIDNTEALGIVNIFAAGNEGPDSLTIRMPANRAEDSITNFAVGGMNNDLTIRNTSSRGPSDCDSVSIKPNVVAPGESILSSIPSTLSHDLLGTFSGTSMAAPHVSGAVAILRQKDPDATVAQIKTALLTSAVDYGDPGPDNDYGWGLIDIAAALNKLTLISQPSIRVSQLDYPEINPGDNVNLNISLINRGTNAANVTAEFKNPEAGITINTASMSFGDINQDAEVAGGSTLDLSFDGGLEIGKFYSLDMDIKIDGALHKTERLSFLIGSRGERTYFNHDAGSIKFTLSNYGAFGFHGTSTANSIVGSYSPFGFYGFQFARDTNDLYEGALVLGTDSNHISDAAQNFALETDNDFKVMTGGSIVASEPGADADQESVCHFDDSWAENPLGLNITQKSYGWANPPDDKFIILEYVLTNDTNVTISNLRVGLYFDWDMRSSNRNHGNWVPASDLGYICYINSSNDTMDFRGTRVLNGEGMVNHRILYWATEIWDGRFSESNKYNGLFNGDRPSFGGNGEVAHITTTGPFTLAPGESDTAVFAITGGLDWASFMTNADLAAQKYDLILDVDDYEPPLPGKLEVSQNYPNPFNPKTTIAFSLPRSGPVTVDVFDILGQKVTTLLNEYREAGPNNVDWLGTDEKGHTVASGVYFYRVTTQDKTSQTKKMLLLK